MSFKILADTFSVSRDSDHFIQVKNLKNPRTEDEMWLVFEVAESPKFARATVQNLIDTFEEVYFDNLNLPPYERFENALKEVNLIFKSLKEKRGDKTLGTISALAAVFANGDLLLTQTRDAEAYMIRKSKLSLISEGLSGRSEDLFVNIASGELLPEDKVLFTTSRLLRLATHNQLVQMCSDGVTETMDSLRELVLGDNELSIGIAFVHVKLPQRSGAALPVQKNSFSFPFMDKIQDFIEPGTEWLKKKWNNAKENIGKRNVLAAIGGVVILLILSVIFLINTRTNHSIREEYRVRLDGLNQELSTATTKGYANDKETANAILDKVAKEGNEILLTDYFRSETEALLKKTEDVRDSINNTRRAKDLKPFADLSTKRDNVEALGILGLKDNLYAFEYNALYEVILSQILDPKTIDETEVVIAGTAIEDQGVSTFLTKSGRIMEYEEGQFRFATTEDETWKPATDITSYGKYIYLLSPEKNQIYKYTRFRSQYSPSSDYNLDADLKGAISFTIDGSIYVLKPGGEIIKIFKSNKQAFEIEDLGADISKATKLYTSAELKNLYVLDPENHRVIIIEKDTSKGGRYKGQMIFDEIDAAQGIFVDKKEEILFVVNKKAIYKIPLK